jgi:hypothetical protein
MPKHAAYSPRNQRNNPYVLDELAITFHRSAAGVAWRWRTELAIFVLLVAAMLRLSLTASWISAVVIVGGTVVVLLAVPATRRFLIRRFWCVLARHRIQRLCWETRLHTRAGRLPLVLWTHPTKVGERAWLICRAGTCAEDFEAHVGELRAACFARDARVTRDPRWSQLVRIDIIRRDTLAAAHHVRSPLTTLQVRPLPGPRTGHDLAPVAAASHDTEPVWVAR